MSFSFPIRVYWEDTDAGGIVFYANYLKFMERARTEWLRSCGISQQALKQETGGMFVVTDTQLKYLQPARLDDLLTVSAEIIEKGRASIKIKQEITLSPAKNLREVLSNQESATLICQGTICIAWVDAGTLKPGRIPKDILEVLN
ncbi:tol-pal system-associated acyl-CoA thioesterase [Variovorax sp. PCZ-1]|uniref:tol-pal system-associated acyl-CoA thioesterase n=1 Tax=Variovorax sp. PCZ-1 TaxID=2835533 RepID=UPI001BCD837F|nr:tol-pal system-associated acyl-CoA thioesterase [Variovorax sp. PCZ-1]MBS7807523.1 tol-pal system-associated acyl-CoA thioesterase [Variovorax sp. PCZ-1]